MHILVTGASGSGTTTLGKALAEQLRVSFLDTDDYFWLPTEPAFQRTRDPASRLDLLRTDLSKVASAVVAGSIVEWGTELEDAFALIVFLTLDAELRVARLRQREFARFGRLDQEFLDWAAQYDEGRLPGRSRPRHEKWLSERSCPVLRLDGDLSVAERTARVIDAVERNNFTASRV